MNNAELQRRLENLIRPGTILAVDSEARPIPKVRVLSGRLETGWLPYFMLAAGEDRDGAAPSVGEGCVIFSPSGEPAVGYVLAGLPTTDFPAPAFSEAQRVRQFRDGAVLRYDSETHHLAAILPSGATFSLESNGGLTINGDVDVIGKITATVDVVADGVSLKDHPHPGVLRGAALTDPPEATA